MCEIIRQGTKPMHDLCLEQSIWNNYYSVLHHTKKETLRMIRKFQKTDIEQIMKIWLNSNIEAHSFVPEKYWKSNFDMVKEQLPQADVYVSDCDGEIQGFIGIADSYIAGIFVDEKYQIGRAHV